jgi:phage-related protein
MPTKLGHDSKGSYYQWGDSGAKYHFKAGDNQSKQEAKNKANKQGQAAYANGYKGK